VLTRDPVRFQNEQEVGFLLQVLCKADNWRLWQDAANTKHTLKIGQDTGVDVSGFRKGDELIAFGTEHILKQLTDGVTHRYAFVEIDTLKHNQKQPIEHGHSHSW